MAVIGALGGSSVSERKRVRAAGRPWKNFCRNELKAKLCEFRFSKVHTKVPNNQNRKSTTERISSQTASEYLENVEPLLNISLLRKNSSLLNMAIRLCKVIFAPIS